MLEDLLEEYRSTLRKVEKERETALEEDDKVFGSMITDLKLAIRWLTLGEQPKPKKTRWVNFKEGSTTIEQIQCVSMANPFAPDPFEEAEKRIDAERRRRKHG